MDIKDWIGYSIALISLLIAPWLSIWVGHKYKYPTIKCYLFTHRDFKKIKEHTNKQDPDYIDAIMCITNDSFAKKVDVNIKYMWVSMTINREKVEIIERGLSLTGVEDPNNIWNNHHFTALKYRGNILIVPNIKDEEFKGSLRGLIPKNINGTPKKEEKEKHGK